MTSNALLDLVELDSLPQSWEIKRLDDVAFINQETTNLKDYSWIHYTDISSVGTRTVEVPSRIEVKDAPSRARRVLRKGDTVISSVRPNRKSFFYFNEEWSNAIASTGFAVLSPRNFGDAEYLHALLTSDNAVKIYETICEGGAYPAFNPSRLGEIKIPWPPYQTRKEVGLTIMNLQSKIAVNNALSKTLEDIAQTIFKSWFIDFDPVKAKMAGGKPVGMDAATAALFPDSMEESELGLIPRGWQVKLLGDLVTPKKGKTITKATCVDGEVPVVAGGLQPAYFHNTANVLQPAITVSASGANAGYVRLYLKDIWASDCSYVNSEITQTVHFWYLFLSRNQELIYGMQQGAAQPHIYPSDLMRLKLSYPNSIDSVMKFEETVTPLFREIGALERQNESLRSLRDSLLPRLISGELQIPEDMLAS